MITLIKDLKNWKLEMVDGYYRVTDKRTSTEIAVTSEATLKLVPKTFHKLIELDNLIEPSTTGGEITKKLVDMAKKNLEVEDLKSDEIELISTRDENNYLEDYTGIVKFGIQTVCFAGKGKNTYTEYTNLEDFLSKMKELELEPGIRKISTEFTGKSDTSLDVNFKI